MSIKEFLLILFVFYSAEEQIVRASEDENRLIHYLFSEQGYNPLVRPTRHSNETVVVAFGLLLVQLIHVRKHWSKIISIVRFVCSGL